MELELVVRKMALIASRVVRDNMVIFFYEETVFEWGSYKLSLSF